MIEHVGPKSRDLIDIDTAWLYCACLYHKGYSDWKFPDKYEHYVAVGLRENAWYTDTISTDPFQFAVPIRTTPKRRKALL